MEMMKQRLFVVLHFCAWLVFRERRGWELERSFDADGICTTDNPNPLEMILQYGLTLLFHLRTDWFPCFFLNFVQLGHDEESSISGFHLRNSSND
ncbi:hypothetical protein B0T20DRAFT_103485 [Sordaria brevicollis]|uniref:Secreted protein n=1 Tax=Sordaria brevicollis TaxID=83679 RepID=A0AAE0NV41_SORBR|nr:hypothetical protein B0T20DRAFT_103485 [Sordaria brevicollis]